MELIEDFSDERQKSWCVHCGRWISQIATNWDHVPSKSLLSKPLPAHTPQVEICTECNTSFSLDEEYFVALLSCILSGTTKPASQINEKVGRALARNKKLQDRIESSRISYTTIGGKKQVFWKPETKRINNVITKNARGHAYHEFGEPMLTKPDSVWFAPLSELSEAQQLDFENVDSPFWPEVGSRMMTRVLTGLDLEDGWVVVQDNIYRYAVLQTGSLSVRSVIWNYLATEVIWSD